MAQKTYWGTVKNVIIVPEESLEIPEGTRVVILVPMPDHEPIDWDANSLAKWERNILQAFTYDCHFEQEGFSCLLR